MGLLDVFYDMSSSLTYATAHAEAPTEDVETPNDVKVEAAGGKTDSESAGDDSHEEGEKQEDQAEGAEDAGGADGGEDAGGESENMDKEEEPEEEEEEPEDIMPKLEAECATSTRCVPHKHHYDDCVERVTAQVDQGGKAKEDCIEEFFHLAHCTTQCAAPKLFARLK